MAAKRLEPAVRHLRFQLTSSGTPGTETSHFCDVARNLSLINRRLYSQSRDYFIKKITVTSRNTQSGLFSVSTAPVSWPIYQGHKMAKKLWNEMQEGHGGAPGSGMPSSITPATWSDFKVWLSDTHRGVGNAGEMLCLDNGNNQVSTANSEWAHSKFYSPDGTTGADEYYVHLLGDHNGPAGSRISVGIVQAYEEARRTVQVDDTGDEVDTDSPWINLFDDGTTLDEIAAAMMGDNDQPPYDRTAYTGGATNMPKPLVASIGAISATSAEGLSDPPNVVYSAPSLVLGGFQAPCGLLEIEIQSSEATDTFDVLIEVAAGDYKGVKSLPM